MILEKYFDGMYLGDGSMISEYIRKDGTEYLRYNLIVRDEQYELFKQVYGKYLADHIKFGYSERYNFKYYTISINNYEFCSKLDKRCGRSHKKHFESNLSDEEMWSVLSGFIDTDGNIDADKLSLCNTDLVLIEGIKQYLELLKISYTVFIQKTKNLPCYWVRIPSEELPHTHFELLVPYKRDRYEELKSRSRGRKIEMGAGWFLSHKEDLKRILPPTTRKRRFRNKWYWLSEYELSKL